MNGYPEAFDFGYTGESGWRGTIGWYRWKIAQHEWLIEHLQWEIENVFEKKIGEIERAK